MIGFSSFNNTNLLHSMFADCCMRKSREWGIMAVVGRLWPPWLIDARDHIEQKTSSPSPILPSAPPPPPRIMPPWWAKSADMKKQPIWRGGCRYDGPEAGCHGRGVCVKLVNLPSKIIHHKQFNRPNRWCANDNIITGTGDQDKNWYAGGPQDHLLSGNTISPLLVRDSLAEPAGVQIDRPDWWWANDNIVTGTGDQDKNRYAGGPQDHLLSGNTMYHLYWFGIAMPNPPAYGAQISTWYLF